MATAAELLVKINADTSGAEAGMQRVSAKVEGFGSTLKTALGTATGFLGAQLVGQLVGNFGQAVSGALDFGKEMANVNSIMQLSDAQLAQYSQQLLDLAGNPGITQMPAELAAGLYNVASSGFQGADAMTVLDVSARAATAGLTSTETSGRAVTSVLNAYGLQASDAQMVSDLLFQTVQDGVISFDQLANNMGNVLPVAASLGIALTDVFSAYSQLTLQGILPSAAETDIAGLMKTALNPTEALTAAVEAQGFANAQTAISTLGLSGYVQLLEKDAAATGKTLFDYLGTQEAVNAALAIGGKNIAAYNEEQERMKHASDGVGATQAALEKQMKSASFQIAKARQEAMILATTLVNYVSPTIAKYTGKAAKGIASFTHWLDKALVGQIRWYKAMGRTNVQALFSALGITLENLTGIDLDGWFKRMGNAMQRPLDAVGKLFDALGDRNWRRAGEAIGDFISAGPKLLGDALKGVNTRFDTLNTILHTVGSSFTDLGRMIQEIGQGDFSGFMDVFDRFLNRITGAQLDVLDWTLNVGVPTVTGWIADAATAAWPYIKEAAGWTGVKLADLGAWTLNTGAPAVTGWIKDAAVDAWPYIKEAAGWTGIKLADLGSWTLNVGVPAVTGWLSTDAWTAIKTAAGWSGAMLLRFDQWELDVAAPAIGGWLAAHKGDAGEALKQLAGWTARMNMKFVEWQLDTAAPAIGGWLNDHKGDLWNGLKILAGIPSKIVGAVDSWVLNVGAPELGGWLKEIGGNFSGWLIGKLNGGNTSATGLFNDAGDQIFGNAGASGLTSAITDMIGGGIDAAITWLGGKVSGWKTDITEKVKSVIPDSITLPTPDFDLSGIKGAVDSAIEKIKGWIDDLKNIWNSLKFWNSDAPGSAPLGQDFGFNNGRVGTGSTTPWITGPGGQPEAPAAPLPLVKIDADTSLADTKISTLNDKVTTFTASPYTGILDFDNGPAAVKYTDAFNWGTVFDAATFTSTFDIDNGPAAVAYTNAFGWGNTWASQVFTASFSVDTSGITNAVAIARQAAADIAAVMPHSPAKEGPLKEPITFDYIADNMRGVADRLRGYAASGAGYVRDSFNDGPGWSMAAAGGRDRGGDTYIVVTPDSEQFADIARKARQGDLNWKTLSALRQRNM